MVWKRGFFPDSGTLLAISTLTYVQLPKCENCECQVANSSRPANRADPSEDDLTRSLMEEYLSATRDPIGASDLFKSSADPPNIPKNKRDYAPSDSENDLAWILILYLFGVIGSLFVAGVWFL